jgi:hypothetical protein
VLSALWKVTRARVLLVFSEIRGSMDLVFLVEG